MNIFSLFIDVFDDISINELLLLIHHFKKNYNSINFLNYSNNLKILLCLSYYYYMLTTIILTYNYLKKYNNSELFLEFNILIGTLKEFYKIYNEIITIESNNLYIDLIQKIILNDTSNIDFNEISADDLKILRTEYFFNFNYFIIKNTPSSILTYNVIFKIIFTILLNYKIDDTYYNNYYSNIILSLNFEFNKNLFIDLFIFGKNIGVNLFYDEKYVKKNFNFERISKNKNINILIINNEYILINFYLKKLNENPNKTKIINDKINDLELLKKECEFKFGDILKKKNIFIKKVLCLTQKNKILINKILSNNLCDYEFCKKKYLIKDITSPENIFQLFVRYYSSIDRFLIEDQTILSLYNFINGILLYKYITLIIETKIDEKAKKNIIAQKKNIKTIINENKNCILDLEASFKFLH